MNATDSRALMVTCPLCAAPVGVHCKSRFTCLARMDLAAHLGTDEVREILRLNAAAVAGPDTELDRRTREG